MDDLQADLRSFRRTLARQPALSATVVGILALGIAAAVVVYGVVEALVLDPFPYPEPEQLVVVGSEMPHAGRELGFFERLSGPEIEDLRARSTTLAHLLPFDLNSVRVGGEDFPRRLFALYTWADPFATLGVTPLVGRGFAPDELRRGAAVAVISHALWQRRFAADPDIVGQSLVADGISYTLIGVAPPASTIFGADLWLPLREPLATLPRAQRQLNLLARLAPGADLVTANADLTAVAAAVEQDVGAEFDAYKDWRLAATTWTRFNAFAYDDEAVLALGAIIFVLLLVCANLANLLLTRAASRRGEVAVRLALGATRQRIMRQVLTESTLFALCGGALGMVLAAWSLDAVVAWLPAALQPMAKPITLDRETFAFAVAATVVASWVCGYAPAFHLGRAAAHSVLGASGRASANRAARRTHRALVVAQVAVAVVLLAGAGTLVVAWTALARQDLGFAVERLVSMRLSLPRDNYEGEAVPRFFADLQDEVAALPGVGAVSIATQVAPNTIFGATLNLEDEVPNGANPRPLHTVVGDGYFQAMGIELLRGRVLDDRDRFGGPCALVVNERAAAHYFPGRDPIGCRAQVVGSRFDSGWCEIVGVVAAVRNQGPAQPAAAEIFSSHRQAGGRYNQMYLLVRASTEPTALVTSIRALVKGLDPAQPVYAITTAEETLAGQLAPRRVTAHLLAAFAALALLLAALGIYGVVAYGVAQRRQEMSLRMALGALRQDLVVLVIREALATVAMGLAVGLCGALVLAQLLRQQLIAVGEPNAWMLLVPAALLALAAIVAAALPALRVGKVVPAAVLRQL